MSFESRSFGEKSVEEQSQDLHLKARQHLRASYDEGKVDAIAAVRGWDVVLAELSALPEDSDPRLWLEREENAQCLEMFGK